MTVDSLEVKIKSDANDAISSLSKLESKLSSIIDLMGKAFGQQTNLTNVKNMTDAFSSMGDKAKEAGNSVKEAMETINRASEKGLGNVKQVTKAVSKINATNSKGKSPEESLQIPTSGEKPSVVGVESKIEPVKELGKAFDLLDPKVKKVETTLSKLKIVIKTDKLIETEKELQKVTNQYNKLAEMMNSKQNDAKYLTSDKYGLDQEKLDALMTERNRLEQLQKSLSQNGGFEFNTEGAVKGLQMFSNGLIKLSGILNGVNSKVRNIFGSMASKIASAVKSSNRLVGAFNGIKSSVANLNKSLSRTYKMLRLMVLRSGIRAALSEFGNGFNYLTLYSDKFNASVSLLWNSIKQLGFSIAAVTVPLINAFAPALNTLIQLCIHAINVINQLFSALSGSNTWIRAKKQTDDYAKSLKKANAQLQGFDELNNITTNKDLQKNPNDLFETKQVSKPIKELADWLKQQAKDLFEPIKKAWDAVGQYIVSSFKFALANVMKLFKDIYRDFMKVWKSDTMVAVWKNVLMILGDILATIGWIAHGLDVAWNYANNGLVIFQTLALIFLVITRHIRNMTKSLRNWARSFDFTPIVTKFRDFIVSIVQVIDFIWGVIEDFFNAVVLGLLDYTLREHGFLWQLMDVFEWFANNVDWEGIRARLQEFWKVVEKFGESVGDGFIIFIDNLTQAIADFLNNGGFDELLTKIENFIGNLDVIDVSKFLTTMAQVLIAFQVLAPVLMGVGNAVKIVCMMMQSGFLSAIAPALPFIAAIVSVIAILGYLYVTSDSVRGAIDRFVGTFADSVVKIGSSLGDLTGAIGRFFNTKAMEWLIGNGLDAISVQIENFANTLSTHIEYSAKVLTFFAEILDTVNNALHGNFDATNLVKSAKEAASAVGQEFRNLGNQATFGISETVIKMASGQKEQVAQASNDIDQLKAKASEIGGVYESSVNRLASASRTSDAEYRSMYQKQDEIRRKSIQDTETDIKNLNADIKEMDTLTASIGTNLAESMPSINEMMNGFFQEDSATTKAKFEEMFKSFGTDSATALSGSLTEGLNTDLENINTKLGTESIPSWLTTISEGTSTDKIAQATQGINDGAMQTVELMNTNYGNSMTKLVNDTQNTYLSSAKFQTIGQNAMNGLIKGLKSKEGEFKSFFDNLATSVNKSLNSINLNVSANGSANGIRKYASGGIVPNGELFIAREAGAEMVGSIGNHTTVANNDQIVAGISSGVASANAEQNGLLSTMVGLLEVIADKDMGISSDAIFQSVRSSASSYSKRTGNNAFA